MGESVLATKEDEERHAADAKDYATVSLKNAQGYMDIEVARINSEKAVFEQVIDILGNLPKSLIEGSDSFQNQNIPSHLVPIVPALIQAARANPDAVNKVIQLVEDLIAGGEKIRAEVIKVRDERQKVLDDKTAEHSAAVEATIAAKDELEAAEQVAAKKLATENIFKKYGKMQLTCTMQLKRMKLPNVQLEKKKYQSLILKMSLYTKSLKFCKDCFKL